MKNPFVRTAIIIGAIFAMFATYQLIMNIGAILGGMFIGSIVTYYATKKPPVLTGGNSDLVDLQNQIDSEINR